jgi:hypothetical protein
LAVEQSVPPRSEFPDDRFQVLPDETARWALRGLIGLVIIAVIVRIWLASRVVTPWIMIDELIYSDLARSVAENGTFHVRGEPIAWFNFGYAALIAPAWLVAEAQSTAHMLAKTINVGLGVLALVPVYLWARRLTTTGYAALAAGLTALMPSLLYASTMMSENGFLPAFLFAALMMGLTIERPTWRRQGLAFAAIGLASLIRLQGLVLLAVFPTAVLLASVLEARVAARGSRLSEARRYLARFWPTGAALVLLVLAYAALKVAQGQPVSTGLGSYRIVAETEYGAVESARWVARHLADLVLASGVFPVSALIVLVGLALLRGAASRAERAFLATTVAAIAWIVPQAALFASNFSFRIEERNLLCLFPLLFVALALWLFRGSPRRPWLLAAVAAVVPAAAVLFALPLRSLLGIQILSDTFGLIPLLRLSQLLSGGIGAVEAVVALAVLAATLTFFFVPARFALVLPVSIAGFFLLSSYAVHGAMREYAEELTKVTSHGDRSWIDHTVGSEQAVDYFYGGGRDLSIEASTLWQAEFWNKSLDDIYNIGVPQPVGIIERLISIDPATGRFELLPQDVPPDRFAVAAERLAVPGRELRHSGQFALYRLDPPARVGLTLEGVYADGWTGDKAILTQYSTPGDRPVRLRVTLSRAGWGGPDVPGRVTLRLGSIVERNGRAAIGKVTESRVWIAHSGKARSFTLRTPPPPYRLELRVSPTFSPGQFGRDDTRQLGVQVDFKALRLQAGS